jgi:drug/metabolite transporter (DMT)-like permease
MAMGVANFLYKVGAATGISPASFLAGQAAIFICLAMGFAWSVDRALAPPRAAWIAGGTAALVFLVALILMFEGLAKGDASALVPITQMGFVVTAAVGVVFLKEPFTLRKVGGLAFAAAALAFLSRG